MINTIFYFPESLSFESYSSMLQNGLISNRTIVFAKQQGSIYMGGKVYGLSNVDLTKKILEPKGNGNTITQSDFDQSNAVYVIRCNLDLEGKKIIIPKNCVLDFEEGVISNGTLVGNNTQIEAPDKTIFDNINISGTWNVPEIYSDWFDNAHEENGLLNCIALSSDDVYNTIRVGTGEYLVSAPENTASALSLKSDTRLLIEGKIRLIASDFISYAILDTNQKENITIEGGVIQGNNSTHSNTGGEWGFGIYIRGGKNCTVKNIEVYDCWGDGIYINEGPENVKITNCHLHNCRRQGVSVINATNVVIDNNTIHDIEGTLPEAAIDVEPNPGNDVCKNILINCNFIYNTSGISVTSKDEGHFQNTCITISNNIIKNSRRRGILIHRCDTASVINNVVSADQRAVYFRSAKRCLILGNNLSITTDVYDDNGCVFGVREEGWPLNTVTIDSNTIDAPNSAAFSWDDGSIISNNNINCYYINRTPAGERHNIRFINNNVTCVKFNLAAGSTSPNSEKILKSVFSGNSIDCVRRGEEEGSLEFLFDGVIFENNRVQVNDRFYTVNGGNITLSNNDIACANVRMLKGNLVANNNRIAVDEDVVLRGNNCNFTENSISCGLGFLSYVGDSDFRNNEFNVEGTTRFTELNVHIVGNKVQGNKFDIEGINAFYEILPDAYSDGIVTKTEDSDYINIEPNADFQWARYNVSENTLYNISYKFTGNEDLYAVYFTGEEEIYEEGGQLKVRYSYLGRLEHVTGETTVVDSVLDTLPLGAVYIWINRQVTNISDTILKDAVNNPKRSEIINNLIDCENVNLPPKNYLLKGNDIHYYNQMEVNFNDRDNILVDLKPFNISIVDNNFRSRRENRHHRLPVYCDETYISGNKFDGITLSLHNKKAKVYNNVFYHPVHSTELEGESAELPGSGIILADVAGKDSVIIGNYFDMGDSDSACIENRSTSGTFLIALNTFTGANRGFSIKTNNDVSSKVASVFNESRGNVLQLVDDNTKGFLSYGLKPGTGYGENAKPLLAWWNSGSELWEDERGITISKTRGDTSDMMALITAPTAVLNSGDKGYMFFNSELGYPCFLTYVDGALKWVKADGTDAPTL